MTSDTPNRSEPESEHGTPVTPAADTRRRTAIITAVAVAVGVVAIAGIALATGLGGPVGEPTIAPSSSAGSTSPSAEPSPSAVPTSETPASAEPTAGSADEFGTPVSADVPRSSEAAVAGYTVSIVSLEDAEAGGQGRGEAAGPGVQVVVRIVNTADQPLDLSAVAINAFSGPESTPGAPVLEGDEFTGTLDAGGTAEGTYRFILAAGDASSTVITVQTTPESDLIVFRP